MDADTLAQLQDYVSGAAPMSSGGLTPDQLAGLQQYIGGGAPPIIPTSNPMAPSPVPGFTAALDAPPPGIPVDPAQPTVPMALGPTDVGGAPGAPAPPGAPPVMPGATPDQLPAGGPAMPAPPAPGGSGGSGGGGMPSWAGGTAAGGPPTQADMKRIQDESHQALEASTKAGIDAATQQAAFADQQQKILQDRALQVAEAQKQRQTEMALNQANVQKTIDEANKPIEKPNPGKWWADQSTFGKAMIMLSGLIGTIGQVMSGYDPHRTKTVYPNGQYVVNGAPPPNIQGSPFIDGIMSAIKQSVQQQKESAQMDLERRKTNVSNAFNLYQLARDKGLDDQQAEAAATSALITQMKYQADAIAQKTQIPQLQANAQMASAALDQKAAENNAQAAHQWEQSYLARQQLGLQRQQLALSQANFGLDVQKTQAQLSKGNQLDDTTQRLLHTVDQGVNNLRLRVQEAKDLIQGKGIKQANGTYLKVPGSFGQASGGTGEVQGPFNDLMTQNLDTIASEWAKVSDPNSVNRPSEIELAKKQLFEPGAMTTTSSKSALMRLDNLLNHAEQKRREWYRQYGLVSDSDPLSVKSFTAGR